MEVTRKLQKLSLTALVVSLLPLTTLVPVFLNITLPDGVGVSKCAGFTRGVALGPQQGVLPPAPPPTFS